MFALTFFRYLKSVSLDLPGFILLISRRKEDYRLFNKRALSYRFELRTTVVL